MKCEQFLPWLESGNRLRVAAARQHALHCESCRAAEQMLQIINRELASDGTLPAKQRQMWMVAADGPATLALEPAAVSPRGRSQFLWAALAAGVAIAVASWMAWSQRGGEPDGGRPLAAETRRIGPIEVVTVDPAAELDQLAGDLSTLKATLSEATLEAEQAAAAEAVERVLVDQRRLIAGNDR